MASAAALAMIVVPAVASPPAEADPASRSGSPQSLLDRIPILPKMTVGYTGAAFPRAFPSGRDRRGCRPTDRALVALAVTAPRVMAGSCTLVGGTWSVDFGTRTVTRARDVRLVPVIPARAAWASGAYGWTPDQRSAFTRDTGSGASSSVVARRRIAGVSWDSALTPMTPALARQAVAQCADSSESTCLMAALPEAIRPRIAVAIAAASTRHRLSMTRSEKALLASAVDHFNADDPGTVLTIRTTGAPALPTTDGSDASGRVVTENLFGLLAPPAWATRPNVPYATLRLWDSGVTWREIEPSPGRFTWGALDAAVRMAQQQGKKVLLVLGPVPRWASANPQSPDEGWGGGAPGPMTPEGRAAFDRYVNAVVARYGSRIWAYEAWNEANLQTFWAGSPAQMASMTKVVHDAVAAHGAGSLVLSASATTRTAGSIYRFFPAYLDELAALGWPVDGFAVHAYPDADGTPSDVTDFVAQFKAYLAIAGAPRLPVYDTELNYGLAGPGPAKPHRDMTPDQAAGWLSRTFIDSVRLGVEETHWFAWTPQYYGQYGIQLTPTSTATRQAWLTTHDWLVGATFRSCEDPRGAVICRFERDGVPFWLAYSDTVDLIDLPSGASQWCDLAGACRPVDGTKVIVGTRPIRIA